MTRDRVRALHAEGWSGRRIAAELGIAPATVSYHLRRLGVPAQSQRRYDWAAVQSFYDEGRTTRECLVHFGMSAQTWHAAQRRGALRTRPVGMPIAELLAGPRDRGHIKDRLIGAGLKEGCCERCGLREWRGAPLSLDLHHVNGNGTDNRLENLELLCPNCHRQTDTFGGRGRAPTPA